MNVKRFLLIFLILTISLSSCTISINENNYLLMSEDERRHFVALPSPLRSDYEVVSAESDSFRVYELCPHVLEQILEKSKYSLIYVWPPYCRSEGSKSALSVMLNLRQKYAADGLNVMLISNSYSLKEIRRGLLDTKYNLPVYVLGNSCYGSKQGGARKKLARELDRNKLLGKNAYFSTYFLTDTMLLKAAWQIPELNIDSLIRIGQLQNN